MDDQAKLSGVEKVPALGTIRPQASSSRFAAIVRIAFCAVMVPTALGVALASDAASFSRKPTFPLPVWAIALVACALVAALLWRWARTEGHRAKVTRRDLRRVVVVTLVVLAVQVLVSFEVRFLGVWDVWTIYETAWNNIAGTLPNEGTLTALSVYPNNLGLLWVEVVLLKAVAVPLGLGFSDALLVLVLADDLVAAVACILLFDVLSRITTRRAALLGWGMGLMLVGLSPWNLVPYTDSLGVILPILALRISMARPQTLRGIVAKYGCLAALAVAAVRFKPQTAFVCFAFALVAAAGARHWAAETSERVGRPAHQVVLAAVTSAAAGLALALVVSGAALGSLGYAIDPQLAMGPAHYAMMGANGDSGGTYSADDVAFSKSFATRAERDAADLARLGERVSSRRLLGSLSFLGAKQLTNWADGTFAWGVEGEFFYADYTDDNPMTLALQSLVYTTGGAYGVLSTTEQLAWLAILCAMCLVALARRGDLDDAVVTGMLAVIVLMVFELVFEARARYLYALLPMMITIGMVGLEAAAARVRDRTGARTGRAE